MTDFFQTRVEKLEPQQEKSKSSAAAKKSKDRKSTTKRKRGDFASSAKVWKIFCVAHAKQEVLYSIWKIQSFYGQVQGLRTMVNKHKQENKKNFKSYRKNNKELNNLIEKSFKNLLRTRKGGKRRRSYNTFKKCNFLTMKTKRLSPAW